MAARYGCGRGTEWASLDALWQKESGWSNTAENPSSGAYGIPQALPPTKMPFAAQKAGGSQPRAQIAWGLSYIKGRYGDPLTAWSGYYDRGGWYGDGGDFVVNRPTLFGAGERGPERVTVTPMAEGGIVAQPRGVAGSTPLPGGPAPGLGASARAVLVWLQRITDAFTKINDAISNHAKRMALALRQATVRIIGGKATRVLTDVQTATQELANLQTTYEELSKEHNQLARRLQQLKQRLSKTKNRKIRQQLQAEINNLSNLLNDNSEAMQQNVEDQLAAQEKIKQAQEDQMQAQRDALDQASQFTQLGLDRLGLQQKLSGTYDTPAARQARAQFIQENVVGGIDQKIALLTQQRQQELASGDTKRAEELRLAIEQALNDKLQAQLEAQQEIAANTEETANLLKEFNGSVGFEFGGQAFTDLLGAGVGA